MRYRREVDVPTGDLDLSVPVVVTQPLYRHLERSPPATAPNTLHSTGNTHTHCTQYWQHTYTLHTVLATHCTQYWQHTYTSHTVLATHTHLIQYWQHTYTPHTVLATHIHTAHCTDNTHTHRTQYWQHTAHSTGNTPHTVLATHIHTALTTHIHT